jgi:hypothetical protein
MNSTSFTTSQLQLYNTSITNTKAQHLVVERDEGRDARGTEDAVGTIALGAGIVRFQSGRNVYSLYAGKVCCVFGRAWTVIVLWGRVVDTWVGAGRQKKIKNLGFRGWNDDREVVIMVL